MDFSMIKKIIGQDKLSKLTSKTISIAGLGGVGSSVAQMLVRNGVNVRIIDKERVYEKEVPRQTLYISDDLNKFKAKQAKKRLEEINKEVKIKAFHEELTKDNIFLIEADLIIDATNDMETSLLINDFALRKGIPLIFTNHAGRKGHVMIVDRKQNKKSACVNCVQDELKLGNIETEGAYIAAVTMVAALATNAAMKNLVGRENIEQLLKIDSLKTEIRHKTIEKKRGCKAGK